MIQMHLQMPIMRKGYFMVSEIQPEKDDDRRQAKHYAPVELLNPEQSGQYEEGTMRAEMPPRYEPYLND
jgi:hypothetical protein